KSSFEATGDLHTEEQFRRWVAPLGAEAEKLGRMLDAGLFDSSSLFHKTLNTALSRDQSEQLSAKPRGIVVPKLPDAGWIGGPPPALTGKPYLIHFWATKACNPDLAVLKNLAQEGANIIGIHPVPVPADEIANFVRDEELPYPTLAGSHQVVGPFMN